jgi:iron(II)-dependent oxidoreductase
MRVAEKGAAATDELLASGLMERVSDARWRSDALFNLLRADAFHERPIPERHRIIFYLGHLEAFDWNLLGESVLGLKSVQPEFDRLFAFGIDPVGGGMPTDLPSDWPDLPVVRDYVQSIRTALDENLVNMNLDAAGGRDGFPLRTMLNVAIEHRLMHTETLAYMLHRLPLHLKVPQADSLILTRIPVDDGMVSIPAGAVTLGLPKSGDMFGWDNEYEAHAVELPAFEIDRYEVTNRQYLKFVLAGGYETRAFWNDDDWNWKNAQGISHPAFWKKENGGWVWRGMFDEIPFDEATLSEPVYVSQAEAAAYARWVGKSLPTEAEWQRAAYGTADGEARPYPWGSEVANSDSKRGNFDFDRWNPTPVNAFPDGQSAFGVHDMLGNAWEWTSTAFHPFPGFEPFPFYRGYSADFFDGKHFVMKGGSPRTAACMLRPSFRNWFQGHYQYVYAGFRCLRR